MDLQAVAAGIGAVCTGAGGTVILIHEFRRRDRRELSADIDTMSDEIRVLRTDLLACRRYSYQLLEVLAEHGLEGPLPPQLHHISTVTSVDPAFDPP